MAMTTNKPVYGQFDERVAQLNAKAKATRKAVRTVKYVTTLDLTLPEEPEGYLFDDPAWQAALEAEVLARHTNGGQPL